MIGEAEPLKVVQESLAALYARMESALGRSNKARAYLTERGLAELEKVGYNPGTIYKGLRQCVVFGLRDEAGEVVSLYGRTIHDKGGKDFYTRGRRGLYPNHPTGFVVIVQSAKLLQIWHNTREHLVQNRSVKPIQNISKSIIAGDFTDPVNGFQITELNVRFGPESKKGRSLEIE